MEPERRSGVAQTLDDAIETIVIPGQINGTAIINDLMIRIGEQLEQHDSLREIDVYDGYSARVSIDLQFGGVYPVAVAADVTVGSIDPKKPVQRVEVVADVTGKPDNSGSLEQTREQVQQAWLTLRPQS